MRRALAYAAALLLGLHGASAQVTSGSSPPVTPQILTIDQDRLFSETVFGGRVSAELESETSALTAENRRIEAELIAEERKLTDLRETMEPEPFQEMANAFDAKVQQIRAEQDAKSRNLQQRADAERQRFFREIVPVLGQIVRERGAVVILDRREVFLSADSIDITDQAISRINARLGVGPGPDAEDGPENGADGN